MHILFLSHYFPPEVNAPASRTFEHTRQWAKDPAVKITVITNNPNHPKGILYPGHSNNWIKKDQIQNINVIRVKTYLAPNAGFIRRTLNYLFFIPAAVSASFSVKKPDIVIGTSPQFFCAVAAFIISRLKRCPFIFELRDIWPESIVTIGAMHKSFVISLLERLELFLYRHSSMIIALTNAFRENLISRGIPATKIKVLKNGVDLSFFKPKERSKELINTLKAENKFIVSYIGTVGMSHAIDKIVDVAEKFSSNPEILFLIVGEGAQKRYIEHIVSTKNLDNIKVLPGVSKKEIIDYYAVTDLNLVTLRNTPLFKTVIPSKIFEIMAMSRPILCAVDGECRQIIEDSDSGIFVEPENVEQIAKCITDLYNKKDLLKKMGESGRLFVEQNADRNKIANEYLNILKDKLNYK